MSFTDSADNTTTDVNPPPVNPNQPQEDPLASPQGPIPRRPMNWPNQTLPQLAGQWDPTQTTQDPNNPNAVAPDQTVSTGGFTPGTPGPFMLAAAMPAGPYGPFGPRPFAMDPRQRFIPAAANREFADWGTPREFSVRPSMWEIPGIYSGLGGQLSQWGPGYVQPFAAMMGMGSGAWMRGYMRGQAALTNQQYQQMRMASYETERRMQEIAREYGQIFATFGGAIPTDPKQAENLKRALWNAAEKFHDEHMKQALEMGLGNAETLARWYDSKHGDLHVTNREREREEREREIGNELSRDDKRLSPAGVPITPSQQEGGAPEPAAPSPAPPAAGAGGNATPEDDGTGNIPGAGWGDDAPAAPAAPSLSKEQPPAAEAPDAAGKKYPAVASADPSFVPQAVDEPKGEQPPEGGDQLGGLPRVAQADTGPGAARPPATTPAAPAAPAAPRPDVTVPRRLTPEEQRESAMDLDPDKIKPIAETLAIDGKLDKRYIGTKYETVIRQRANEMQRQLNELLDPNSKLTGDALVERLKQISPRYAAAVDAMRKGQLPMGRGGAGQFMKGPMSTVLSLAMKAEPGMDLNRFQQRAQFQRWITTGQGANQLIRLGTAYGHSKATLDRLKNMPNQFWLDLQEIGTEKDAGMIKKWIGRMADKYDPQSAAALGQLQADLRTLSDEYMAIMVMTGAGSMTEREGIRESLSWSHPNRAIGQINEMMERIKDREGALRANATRSGMKYDELINNIGSGAPPAPDQFGPYDPSKGAAGMREMEQDRRSRGGGAAQPPANYDSLPSGAEYTDSEGNVRRKR